MHENGMTLAQAIRQGAQGQPQCHGTYFCDGGSCALGAAYRAMGGVERREDYIGTSLAEHFPVLRKKADHPVMMVTRRIKEIIVSLNDEHLWTHEQIADWIETLQLEEG